jgi:cell division protease FtsH
MTREFALNQIAILMGGRVAEEIVFQQKTTGAGNDIERATELARSMVTEWGMSDAFGPLNFSTSGKQEVFLGRDFNQNSTHSEDTSQRIDAEIRRIVVSEYERALKILTERRKELEQIAEALLEYETLDGDDLDTLLRGGKLERPIAAVARKQAKETASAAEGEDARKRPGIIPPKPTPEPA